MTDKYVAVGDCFDKCFKGQVGEYPDNDSAMGKDYHLGTTPIHSILLCTKACLSGQRFTFGNFKFDKNLALAYSAKKISDVKAAIAQITVPPDSRRLAALTAAEPVSAAAKTKKKKPAAKKAPAKKAAAKRKVRKKN
jgi:hypothetical protein